LSVLNIPIESEPKRLRAVDLRYWVSVF
jgi:hypothetical protein